MYELRVKGDIASSHHLIGYQGKCRQLHGHTWKVEAVVSGGKLDKLGMVADFKTLKLTLKEILDPLDHTCLNDHAVFQKANPTAENLARHIYRSYAAAIKPLKLKHVEVWESDVTSVLYYE